LAGQFEISYQTADRIVRELMREGLLLRRTGSGTYIPGEKRTLISVQLVFHRRARRKSSFGARLLATVIAGLDAANIEWRMSWFDASAGQLPRLMAGRYPVIWEATPVVNLACTQQRMALLINDRPPAGLAALHLDSISVDDYSGGACAAQLLLSRLSTEVKTITNAPGRQFCVLSGPRGDLRSAARAAGFLSLTPARVVYSPDWFLEGGLACAARAVAQGPDGIFCCNDRLAESIVRHCRAQRVAPPPLIGFDDAPIATWLGLTTMAIPWTALREAVTATVRRRLDGDTSAATSLVLPTFPQMRR
jgi:hypothetical protein